MQRRSFLSVLGAGSLLHLPLWVEASSKPPAQEWGPPTLLVARPEHQRVVLSFSPVKEATSYIVRFRNPQGVESNIKEVLVTDY